MAGTVTAPPGRIIDRPRRIALGYPESWEDAPWGHPVFKAGKRIFVMVGDADGGWGMSVPVGDELQALLLQKERFYRPSYVGHKGWIGLYLRSDTDWDEVAGLIDIAYRRVALQRMVKALDGRGS